MARAHGDTNAFYTMPHADAVFVLVVLTDAEFALIFADPVMSIRNQSVSEAPRLPRTGQCCGYRMTAREAYE